MTPVQKRTWKWLACSWYLLFFGSEVCIFPFVNVYIRAKGLTEQQIGVIGALRPWIGVPSSGLASLAADYLGAHREIMLLLYIAANSVRLMLPFATSYASILAICVMTECFLSPVTIMVDAAVVGKCTQEGEYGRYRLWGAVGWGSLSSVSGALIDRFGIMAAFTLNLVFMVPCAILSPFLFSKPKATPQLRKDSDASLLDSTSGGKALPSKHHAVMTEMSSLAPHASPGEAAPHHAAGCAQAVDKRALSLRRTVGTPQDSPRHSPRHPNTHPRRGSLDAMFTLEDLHPLGSEGPREHDGLSHRKHNQHTGSPMDHDHDQEEGTHLLDPTQHAEGRHPQVRSRLGCETDHNGVVDASPAPEHMPFSKKLAQVFSLPAAWVFFWTAIVMGLGFGLIEAYLFLLLRELGATDLLMGLTLTITCMAEAPVFHFQGRLIKWLGSPDALLDICLAAYVTRLLGYAALPWTPSPWFVLLIEPLHGLTFACGWGAGCEKSKALAPPGLEATLQGAFQALYFGLGYGTGALLGGIVSEKFGFQVLYASGACLVGVGWLIAVAGRVAVSRLSAMPYARLSSAEA
eukprot:CAMPEP_0202895978 /NCGR_PEP_ID=MMETSP1392-20130828/5071_1 /ASSEMBLY_ACC=CAM_ASM_000868 /TAXON_ID=225041 /ORGANISM="Chlamydomonas chlamydogama, Strain SAG 11-48b" /LENGTH=574 /DNA_ID=CAMNT_0049581183 /DNA_START=53 /DNA_END=1777 /DNA_ORIENTATION=-